MSATDITVVPPIRTPVLPSTPGCFGINSAFLRAFQFALIPLIGAHAFELDAYAGSSLYNRWDQGEVTPPGYRTTNAANHLGIYARDEATRFKFMVMTSVGQEFWPQIDPLRGRDEVIAKSWIDFLWAIGNGGKGTQAYLLPFTVPLNLPVFQQFVDHRRMVFFRIQDEHNARCPAGKPPVMYIPVLDCFERIFHDMLAGHPIAATLFDGLYGTEETPRLHLAAKGEWLNIAVVVWCTLLGRDPTLMPATIGVNPSGTSTIPKTQPTADERAYMAVVIKDVISALSWRVGVDTSGWA